MIIPPFLPLEVFAEIADALKEHAAIMRYSYGSEKTLCKDVLRFDAAKDATGRFLSFRFNPDVKEIWFGFRTDKVSQAQFQALCKILEGLKPEPTEHVQVDSEAKTAIYHWYFHR